MRSRVAWMLAGAGIALAATARFLRRPPTRHVVPAPRPAPEPEPDPRADELRARIDEARELVGEREEFESAETPVDEADPNLRRQAVHERGRSAVDRMRGR